MGKCSASIGILGMQKKRIIVGVSGASGAPLALRLLDELKKVPDVESHLVITRGGEMTIEEECGMSVSQFCSKADVIYDVKNIGAAIASGTYKTIGMVVCPCSMKTVAGIAHGYSDNLLLRAADVVLKEQRRLVLVTRESPLSKVHLDNMAYLAGLPGVFILPPVISYYSHPQSLDDVEKQIVGRILDRFDIDAGLKRWNP